MVALAGLVAAGCAPPPTASPSPTLSAAASGTGSIDVDASLLDHLPPEVSGITVEFSEEASEDAARSSDLTGAASLAYAVAADAARGDVLVTIVLRPATGALDDNAFRRIRDSYDSAVCGPEGGLRGNGEAELGGRLVQIGTCKGGSHTYATRLEDSGVVVLAFSQGEGRLGEQLMARLRDP